MCGFLGRAPISEVSVEHPRHIAVTADMTSATWNTVATHEVFTVTGRVLMLMWMEVVIVPSSGAGGGCTACLQVGNELATDALIGSTIEGNFVAETFWFAQDTFGPTVVWTDFYFTPFHLANYGLDIGYEITSEPVESGNLVFHCIWAPLSVGATVTAGAGGPL